MNNQKLKESLKIKSTNDILKILCESIKETLEITTQSQIKYSSTFIKTTKTCLRPDIGCFVMFEGGFSGLVAMNFSAQAALEIYRRYNLNMGIPEKELASYHTSQEVADAMGELMNQSVGRFQVDLKKQIGIGVNQSQPKMVALNQAMRIALEAEVDRPQYRRVEFRTNHNNLFYVEITTEKVEFIVDSKLIEETNQWLKQNLENTDKMSQSKSMPNQADEDFMQKLGL